MNKKKKDLAHISLIFGIISIIIIFFPFINVFLSLTGFTLSIVACREAKFYKSTKNKSIISLIINSLALILSILFLYFMFISILHKDKTDNSDLNNINKPELVLPENKNDSLVNDNDSLLLDSSEINNLDNTVYDTTNGPGNAPE
jgi:amino acid transporter